ncbi:MAG: homoserine O-succinyltransferase [Hyphomonadaceae bacterium]
MSALALRQDEQVIDEDVRVEIPASFALQSGDRLEDAAILVRLHGRRGAPVIAVLGGISAGRHVAGDHGWWRDIVAPGAAIDPRDFTILGIEFAPIADQRVRLSPQDQARLIEHALDDLGIERLFAFVGASYGGMVGLALAARAPDRIERLCVISAADRPGALGSAWRGVQRRIVEFGLAHSDGEGGLSLARQLAMTTYRSASEFEGRFEAGVGADGKGGVDDYLIARGEAYPQVMSARRWLSLSEAIDRHSVDVGTITTPTTLIGASSDQLVPIDAIRFLASKLPAVKAVHEIQSIYGHDAFLKEAASIGAILAQVLESN